MRQFPSTLRFMTAALLAASLLSGCATLRKSAERIEAADEINAGACPRAFTLYDAARYIQFVGGREAYSAVGFTAEMGKVRSICRYVGPAPIDADLTFSVDLGRGPAAQGDNFTYNYFVAVTRKNIDVIHKENFAFNVTFPAGVDTLTHTETVSSIIIPRANDTTSGENFEIIIGFELNAQQKAFNREGKRFRVSAGQGG